MNEFQEQKSFSRHFQNIQQNFSLAALQVSKLLFEKKFYSMKDSAMSRNKSLQTDIVIIKLQKATEC